MDKPKRPSGALTIEEIAVRMDLHPKVVEAAVERLIARGLVEEVCDDE